MIVAGGRVKVMQVIRKSTTHSIERAGKPIAAVRLHYDDLADATPGACEGELDTRLSNDASALTPLDALVSARLSATEAAGSLEASNALFRQGRADEARAVLVRAQQKVAESQAQVRKNEADALRATE